MGSEAEVPPAVGVPLPPPPAAAAPAAASAAPPPPPPPQRARRKSAKAAAACVAAAIKEEMLAPAHHRPPPPKAKAKRSYSRGNSQGSAASSSGGGPGGGGGGGGSCGGRRGGLGPSSRKKTALSAHAVDYLKAWMMSPDHIEHPYPTEDEKARIMRETGIELKQLTNWFVNNRKRYWKPKVEELRRRSLQGNVTLQEIAARDLKAAPPGKPAPEPLPPRREDGADKSAAVVSSEGEESAHSLRLPGPARPAPRASPPGAKKRRSKPGGAAARAAAQPRGKKLRPPPPPVADPMRVPSSSDPALPPTAEPAGKIHVAASHASVRAARKMSRESLGSVDGPSGDRGGVVRGGLGQGKVLPPPGASSSVGVSNPLAVALSPAMAAAAASSSPLEGPLPSPRCIAAPPAYVPPLPGVTAPGGVLDADLVADLDYSISPLDNQVVANTGTAAAASAGFTCGIMPHSCNLADPTNPNCQPCALCCACRDWNLGEFCPWDLTGIIGDIGLHADVAVPSSSAPSPRAVSSSSASEGSSHEDDFAGPASALPPVASSSPSPYATRPDGEGTVGEATTITKTSMVEVADVASIDGAAADYGAPALAVPHEISHSSSAADFISSMVDIESWD